MSIRAGCIVISFSGLDVHVSEAEVAEACRLIAIEAEEWAVEHGLIAADAQLRAVQEEPESLSVQV